MQLGSKCPSSYSTLKVSIALHSPNLCQLFTVSAYFAVWSTHFWRRASQAFFFSPRDYSTIYLPPSETIHSQPWKPPYHPHHSSALQSISWVLVLSFPYPRTPSTDPRDGVGSGRSPQGALPKAEEGARLCVYIGRGEETYHRPTYQRYLYRGRLLQHCSNSSRCK